MLRGSFFRFLMGLLDAGELRARVNLLEPKLVTVAPKGELPPLLLAKIPSVDGSIYICIRICLIDKQS